MCVRVRASLPLLHFALLKKTAHSLSAYINRKDPLLDVPSPSIRKAVHGGLPVNHPRLWNFLVGKYYYGRE